MIFKYHFLIMSFLMLFLFTGCETSFQKTNKTNDNDLNITSVNLIQEKKSSLTTIKGVVVNKTNNFKDGSGWTFKTFTGDIYNLIISIPNLGKIESKKMKHVIINSALTLVGEKILFGNKKTFIVRKIIVNSKPID